MTKVVKKKKCIAALVDLIDSSLRTCYILIMYFSVCQHLPSGVVY